MATPLFGLNRQQPRPAALGVLFAGPRPYGFAAAPTRPGRRGGGAVYPVLHGLLQAGRVKSISPINIMQTNTHRGQG
jgi:hypothetical protein